MKHRKKHLTNILFMDKFLSEQELRARRVRRAKVRLAAIRDRRPLTMLTQTLEAQPVEADAIELQSSVRPKLSIRAVQSPSFIIHSVEV